jgi:GTP-binding protein EngB required for normal cell division
MSLEIQPDALTAVLHRCRRAELEPLARAVGLRPEGFGLGDLARATAAGIRRAAAHPVRTALRGDRGPSYTSIVLIYANKFGIPPEPFEVAEFELAQRRLTRLHPLTSSEQRAAFWLRPPDLRSTLVLAAVLFAGPLGCLTRPLLIPLLPLIVWRSLRPDENRVLDLIVEVARLRERLKHRVTVGVVGSPSSGKDSAIRVLFGIDTGNVSPIAGSTREVSIHPLEGAPHLFVVNTPGLGDIDAAVHEESRQILDHIDIYLYLVNAEGGVQAREKADYDRCVATGKPVLAVVNKVDVLRPRDRDRFLEDCRTKLGAQQSAFIAAAFDPLPELSAAPLHVDEVDAWIRDQLVAIGRSATDLPALPSSPKTR